MPGRPLITSLSREIEFATFRQGTDEILVIHDGMRKVSRWNFRTGEWIPTPIRSEPPQTPFVMAKFAQNPDTLVMARVGGILEFQNMSDGKILKTIYLPEIGNRRIREVAFTDHLDRMFVAMGFQDLFLIDVLTGKVLYHWILQDREILKIAMSRNGQSLWVLESPPDVDTGQKIFQRLRRIRRIHSPGAISDAGRMLDEKPEWIRGLARSNQK
jgi:hypothetical protein